MRVLLIGIAVLAALYLVILILAYSFQRSLMYFPDQIAADDAALDRSGFGAVSIIVPEAGKLTSIWRAPKDENAPVFIHFHGNGGSLSGRIPIYQDMATDGAGVLAIGYPGYGGNPGSPSESAFFAAARANYDWLIAQNIAPERIVIVGQSIGSGAATWLATQNQTQTQTKAAGLILEAPFTATDDIAASQFAFLPARVLMKDKFRNIDRIKSINMPLVWIHGTADDQIPFNMGQRLFDAAAQPKTAYPIEAGGHNDLWMRGIGEIIRREGQTLMAQKPAA